MLLSADPPESSGKPEVMLGACNSMIEHKEVFTLGGGVIGMLMVIMITSNEVLSDSPYSL